MMAKYVHLRIRLLLNIINTYFRLYFPYFRYGTNCEEYWVYYKLIKEILIFNGILCQEFFDIPTTKYRVLQSINTDLEREILLNEVNSHTFIMVQCVSFSIVLEFNCFE